MREPSGLAVMEMRDDRAATKHTGRRALAGLDGIRALAVILVILSHSKEAFRPHSLLHAFAIRGGFGVHVFFVLSGYLITYLLLREEEEFGRVDLLKFYKRRMIRIVPPTYVLILALLGMAAMGWIAISPLCVTSCFLFFRNYVNGPTVSGHLWTLAVEEHFYLIWPVIFITVRNLKLRASIALLAVLVAPIWRFYVERNSYGATTHVGFRTDMRFDAILMGCLGALLTRLPRAEKCLGSKPFSNPFFGVCVIALLVGTFSGRFLANPVLNFSKFTIQYVCLTLLMNFLVRTPRGWLSRFLDLYPLALLGRLSFSIYLWQQLFHAAAWPDNPSPWLRWPLNLVPIVVCATLSYLLVEKRFSECAPAIDRFESTHARFGAFSQHMMRAITHKIVRDIVFRLTMSRDLT